MGIKVSSFTCFFFRSQVQHVFFTPTQASRVFFFFFCFVSLCFVFFFTSDTSYRFSYPCSPITISLIPDTPASCSPTPVLPADFSRFVVTRVSLFLLQCNLHPFLLFHFHLLFFLYSSLTTCFHSFTSA